MCNSSLKPSKHFFVFEQIDVLLNEPRANPQAGGGVGGVGLPSFIDQGGRRVF